MTTENRANDELSGELARLVLEQVAPDELAIFELTAEEYFADRQGVLNPQRREESVGFGLDLALLTPYVLAVASMVVTWLGTTVAEAAREESTAVVTSWIRRLFRRSQQNSPAPEPVRPLSIDQARRIREVAFQRAKALGTTTRPPSSPTRSSARFSWSRDDHGQERHRTGRPASGTAVSAGLPSTDHQPVPRAPGRAARLGAVRR